VESGVGSKFGGVPPQLTVRPTRKTAIPVKERALAVLLSIPGSSDGEHTAVEYSGSV
jgi:hypothetical protein